MIFLNIVLFGERDKLSYKNLSHRFIDKKSKNEIINLYI